VDVLDRRDLLRRAGAAALAIGAGSAWVRSASGATPPLQALSRSLDGDLVTRGSSRYTTAKRLYDTRFDAIRPLAIAYCESIADVQRCVRFCARNGARPAARSGGHSYGGYSTAAGGLVIDVSRLARIITSAAGAQIGAGAPLSDVYQRLWRLGAAIPSGTCPTVGVAGITLGGGVGFSSRKLGLTCDALQELTIVTADGRRRTCSEDENADLFWACRGGGGGNFGVVTDFTFMTYPVSNVTTYTASWSWEHAAAVVDAWQRFAPDAPDELFSVCRLETASGGPSVGSSGQFFGSESELRSLLAPLVAAAEPSQLSVTERSFIQAVSYFSGGSGRATFAAKSDYVRNPLSSAGIGVLVNAIESRQAAGGTGDILLDAYGGAINRVAPAATAFVHRRERFGLQELAFWPQGSASGQAAGQRWLSALHRALRPHVSGFAYQNYIDPTLTGWQQAYYGTNYVRLQRIKRRVDPGNLFRFNQSIRG
jgi:FAD binding domain/Berberine and berberine like